MLSLFQKIHHLFLVYCLCVCATVCLFHTARADGGAPNLAYVAGTPKGISIIDIAQQKVVRSITTPESPQSLLLSIDGRYLFITQPQQGRFLALSAKTGETICTANVPGDPSLLALDPIINVLYVAGNAANRVTELDGLTCKIKRVFLTKDPVYGVALAFAGPNLTNTKDNQLWVATTHTLQTFDASTGRALDTIALPQGQRSQFLTIPPGSTVYAATRQGSIEAIDIKSHTMLTLVTGGSYGPMDFNEQTGEIFVPDRKKTRLLVLSPVTVGAPLPQEPRRVVAFPFAPVSVAITSDGQLGFVALQNGTVSILDLPGRQTITTLFVGGSPHFIVTGLYPPLVGLIPQETTLLGTLVNDGAYTLLFLLIFAPLTYFWFLARKKRANHL
ncbi:YncE family protein [Ktedonobacteria bacterium brp13]|nr:YncE family protein [Ktedonobacteria bacterium brp13]